MAVWGMSRTADYHMHTPLCRHAEGTPSDYAAAAIAQRLPEIGLSDHSPMPSHFDDWRMRIEEFPSYLELVEQARHDHPGFPIKLGLEVDYFDDGLKWIDQLAEMAPWDYFIGSVHYIQDQKNTLGRWDIDNPAFEPRYVASPHATDEIWDQYWETYVRAIRSQRFDLMGHPDLPKKFGHRPSGDLNKLYEPAIEAAAATGVAIELNTAGWHKEAAEQYPARPFLEMMHEAGIPLSISSDAHDPAHVGRDFNKAIALVKEIGFTHTVRFSQRQRTLVALD